MNSQLIKKGKPVVVVKASGEEEVFHVDKLISSLRNAGTDNKTIEIIVENIKKWIYSGVSTRKIYSKAYALLNKQRTLSALRYRLKQAIMEFGSTGYPFETFMGQIFEKLGFKTEVGVVVHGNCVTHEMDVIATGNGKQYLVECKYSKDQGKMVSIQVPLYVRARVDDIIRKRQDMPQYKGLNFSGWVITNTRFSSDSEQYAKCAGLKLLAWNYPVGNGLKYIIEKEKIYPVTILESLSNNEKSFLLKNDIVTCNQLFNNSDLIQKFKLKKRKYLQLMEELSAICEE